MPSYLIDCARPHESGEYCQCIDEVSAEALCQNQPLPTMNHIVRAARYDLPSVSPTHRFRRSPLHKHRDGTRTHSAPLDDGHLLLIDNQNAIPAGPKARSVTIMPRIIELFMFSLWLLAESATNFISKALFNLIYPTASSQGASHFAIDRKR